MKDAADLPSVFAQNFQRVIPRIALMDYDIHSKLDREIEKLFEQLGLLRLVGAVFDARFNLFLGAALQSIENLHVLALRCFDAGQIMIIESDLADRNDAWIFRQFASCA